MDGAVRRAFGGIGLLVFLLSLAAFHAPEAAADEAPALAFDSRNDRHLLVFVRRDIGLTAQVYGQLRQCDGSAVGSAFVLSEGNAEKRAPAVAYDDAEGRFLVVWEEGPAGAANLFGRLVRADGSPLDPIMTISNADGDQRNPKAVYDSTSGRFLVVWGDNRGVNGYDIYGQLVRADGTPYGSNFPISESTNDQRNPSVAYDSASRQFLVAWSDDRSGSSSDMYGQLLDANGTPSGSNFIISDADGDQRNPSVAYDSASRQFLVAWSDDRSGSSSDMYGQLLRANGTPSGSNFIISDATGDQGNPVAVFDGVNRRFLVAWEDSRSGSRDIYARYVGADGSPSGGDFVVSSAPYDQVSPVASFNSRSANFLVAYETSRLEGDVQISTVSLVLVGPACVAPGGESGRCFIATAAFGSPLDPHVRVLRSFRDNYLLTNAAGRLLVGLYNGVSPPVASFISRHESAKTAARWALILIVYALEFPGEAMLLLFGGIIAPLAAYRLRKAGPPRCTRTG